MCYSVHIQGAHPYVIGQDKGVDWQGVRLGRDIAFRPLNIRLIIQIKFCMDCPWRVLPKNGICHIYKNVIIQSTSCDSN